MRERWCYAFKLLEAAIVEALAHLLLSFLVVIWELVAVSTVSGGVVWKNKLSRVLVGLVILQRRILLMKTTVMV